MNCYNLVTACRHNALFTLLALHLLLALLYVLLGVGGGEYQKAAIPPAVLQFLTFIPSIAFVVVLLRSLTLLCSPLDSSSRCHSLYLMHSYHNCHIRLLPCRPHHYIFPKGRTLLRTSYSFLSLHYRVVEPSHIASWRCLSCSGADHFVPSFRGRCLLAHTIKIAFLWMFDPEYIAFSSERGHPALGSPIFLTTILSMLLLRH